MRRNIAAARGIRVALSAAILAVSGVAMAQPGEEVTIESTRPTRTVGHSYTGVPIEVTTVTRKVRFSDLDLTTYSGATELQKRVHDTAKMLCKQLTEVYPMTASEGPQCVRQASRDAMVQANAVIDAAAKRSQAR